MKYKFSGINPNTKKKKEFWIEAKSYEGAWQKANLCYGSYKRLKYERVGHPDDPKAKSFGKVDHLANMLKF
tara:strand:- start:498 stop:710 length:213 start_codon:yes stop_codon:yes gene_type:complete